MSDPRKSFYAFKLPGMELVKASEDIGDLLALPEPCFIVPGSMGQVLAACSKRLAEPQDEP